MADKPPFLERIDELEHLEIVRLKGPIDKDTIPLIEEYIRQTRRQGPMIKKNVLIDYAQVTGVDTSVVALQMVRLKDYETHGFKLGFINLTDQLKTLYDMNKLSKSFRVYRSEKEALKELDQL